MVNESQRQRAQVFRQLHLEPGTFIMPNAWDAGSARVLGAQGFACVGTTSAGIAFAEGFPDHQRISQDHMLERVGRIAAAVPLPVSADLEAGYGDSPEAVANTIQLAIQRGVVGCNIEDFTGRSDAPLYDHALAVARIAAAREAADALGLTFTLTARTDPYLVGHPNAFAESVARANAYFEAGANCLFVPGVADAATIAGLVNEIQGPINLVMGLSSNTLSFTELAQLGVKRISIGGSLSRAVFWLVRNAAEEMQQRGTFRFADVQIDHGSLCKFFATGNW